MQRAYAARLLGVIAVVEAPASDSEQAVLDRLAQFAAGRLDPALVPRLPALLPRLLGLLRRGDGDTRPLVELISRDPTLVGEVMRLANMPLYGFSRRIVDLHDAVQLLGQVGLAALVARVVSRPLFNLSQGRFGRTAGAPLWLLAERCAHLSSWARRGRSDAFAAYLAGMATPVGLMVAVRMLDQTYSAGQAPRSAGFLEALLPKATAVSAVAARDWGFPDESSQALAALGSGRGGELAGVLGMARHLAMRQALPPAGRPSLPDGEAALAEAELERAFPTTGAAP